MFYDYSGYDEICARHLRHSLGTLRLTETDTPQVFVEPITVAEAKKHLRLDTDTEDDLIEMYISGARNQAELMQNRVLASRQFDLVFDRWPSRVITLSAPTTSVDLVQYKDAEEELTTLDPEDYVVDLKKEPAIIIPPAHQPWPHFDPWPSSAILIRYTAGYAADSPFWKGPGARVKNGMLLLISAWYNNRLPYTTGQTATQEYPFAVTACLSQGARPRVA